VFSPVPAAFNFQPNGTTGTNPLLKISGQSDIVVEGATGYVN
jgi:hypothetical protein